MDRQPLHAGVDCGNCLCGVLYAAYFRCISFTDAGHADRCGYIAGPFHGRLVYKPQGKGHFWEPDDRDGWLAATIWGDHGGHGDGSDRNYWVPDRVGSCDG